jgi:N-acetylmuramoyl-L-alanine amidase
LSSMSRNPTRSLWKKSGCLLLACCMLLLTLPSQAQAAGLRAWAHDSTGATQPASTWYLAEGSTDGGMETFVLVQNPNPQDVHANISFETDQGPQAPAQLQGITIPASSRRTFKVNDYLTTYNVSTKVTATDGNVVCERSMYGNNRTWAHESIGASVTAKTWYLAEGCTSGSFETWVLVQNPGDAPANIDMSIQSDNGQAQGPRDVIPARSRRSYDLRAYIDSFNVSTKVTSDSDIVCERAMYGGYVVCLDPGHAATPSEIDPDTGLNTEDWINEPEIGIVYDISLRAKAILESRGVSVVITKSSQYEPVSLKQRAVIANEAHAAMIVHVHCDPGLSGPTTYYPGPPPYNWKGNSDNGRIAYLDPVIQAASERTARNFHPVMASYLARVGGAPNGGLVMENRGATGTGDYGPIFSYDIWSEVPTFTLENNLAFADGHRQQVAEGIAEGIIACLGR